MHSVTLICSAHSARGSCTAEELTRILGAHEPEVIFLEIPPSQFDRFVHRGNLEAAAVARFRRSNPCRLVEVDTYQPSFDLLGLKTNLDEMFDAVRQGSPEYCELESQVESNTQEYGFQYLNSDVAAIATRRLEEIEDEVVFRLADPRLENTLRSWRQLHAARERQMVENVVEFCERNAFQRAVFLIGAAHKAGVLRGVTASAGRGEISWLPGTQRTAFPLAP